MITVSQSKIKRWRRCRYAYHQKYIKNLERVRPARPLLVGSMIHEVHDAMVNGTPWGDIIDGYAKKYKKLFIEEQEMYGDIPALVETVMENYEKRWEGDGLKYLEKDGKKSEYDFEVPLIPGKVNFKGRIDAVVKDKKKRVWLKEVKSFKKMPSEQVRFTDLQTGLYYPVVSQLGFPKPDGVLWDYVRTKPPAIPEQLKNGQLSKNKGIDTTREIYLAEIDRLKLNPQDYTDILEKLEGNEDNFLRRIYLPAPTAIADTLNKELKETAMEIYYLGECSKARNISWDCGPRCDFHPLCQAELRGLDVDYIVSTEYRERRDDDGETETEEELE